MTRKCIAAFIIVLLLFTGCSKKAEGETVRVYYLRDLTSTSDSAVEAVDIPVAPYARKAETAMNHLMKKPKVDGLSSPFPEDISIESITYDGDRAIVQLSEEYGDLSGAGLAIADACAVMTLTGIEGISSVKLTVAGRPHPAHDREYLSAEDIVINDLSLKPVEMNAVLYFSNGNTEYVVAEQRNIIIRENEPIEQYVVEELIKGPSEENHRRILDENTELISIDTVKKICYVNFSSEFRDWISKSRAAEIQTLNAVTNSLCGIDGIEGVQYRVDGELIYGNSVVRGNDVSIGEFYEPSMTETLYLADTTGKYLEPITVRIKAGGGYTIERLIVERLITGIDGHGFFAVIPQGTRLLSLENEKNTCILNFSEEFTANDTGVISRTMLYQSIALSLSDANSDIESVKIMVNGADINKGMAIYPNRKWVKQESE